MVASQTCLTFRLTDTCQYYVSLDFACSRHKLLLKNQNQLGVGSAECATPHQGQGMKFTCDISEKHMKSSRFFLWKFAFHFTSWDNS